MLLLALSLKIGKQKLKDINEKGGNLLLNVGPDGNGVVQREAYDILRKTAEMLKLNPIEKKIPQINELEK